MRKPMTRQSTPDDLGVRLPTGSTGRRAAAPLARPARCIITPRFSGNGRKERIMATSIGRHWNVMAIGYAAAALSACGGGAGGSVASVGTAPPPPARAPAPTPAPTPTPAASLPVALITPVQTSNPATLVATAGGPSIANPPSSVTLSLLQTSVAIKGRFDGDASTAAQGATLNINGATGRYGFTLNNGTLDVVDATATTERYVSGGYFMFGTPISGGRNLQTAANSLDYTTYGYWLIGGPVSSGSFDWTGGGTWLGGYVTPASAIPNSGTASYAGQVTGLYDESGIPPGNVALLFGDVRVTADFAARSVSGTMTNLSLGSDWVSHTPLNDLAFAATFDPAANLFTGTTRVTNAPGGASAFSSDASGVVSGRFFGPAASEVGGVFTLADAARRLIGSFGARQ